jgi:hypothetical protein
MSLFRTADRIDYSIRNSPRWPRWWGPFSTGGISPMQVRGGDFDGARRSKDWLKFKNSDASDVKREAERD